MHAAASLLEPATLHPAPSRADIAGMAAILRASVLIDASDLFGAIEWILATARRTGLTLQSMALDENDAQAPMRHLDLKTNAGTAELLDLFLHRLRNGVDVRGVQVHGREPSSVTALRHC